MASVTSVVDFDWFLETFLTGAAPDASPSSRTARMLDFDHTTRAFDPNPFSRMRGTRGKKVANGSVRGEEPARIVAALNRANLVGGHKFVSSYSPPDADAALECGLYPVAALPAELVSRGHGHLQQTNWSDMEILVQIRTQQDAEDWFDEARSLDESGSERDRSLNARQIDKFLGCLKQQFDRQHRQFVYMILFFGRFARILRIDHSSVFATRRFKYLEEGAKLSHFLRLYSRLSLADRGHDTAAVRLKPDGPEADAMRARAAAVKEGDYGGELFRKRLDSSWPWWKLDVPDDSPDRKGSVRSFLVAKPNFYEKDVIGPSTRGYVALDAEDPLHGDFVYLKDMWRIVNGQYMQEGAVLEELRDGRVPFVPTMVCGGDIEGQVTTTSELWQCFRPLRGQVSRLKTHQHYRLVTQEVCKSLDGVESSRHLVAAMACCFQAHQGAYALGFLHRDISAGNILLHQGKDGTWHGLLNDWELAIKMENQEPASYSQPPRRIGTYEFMSMAMLNNRWKVIDLQDELEAFIHVLLEYAIRLLYHNIEREAALPEFLKDYYYDIYDTYGDIRCGTMRADTMRWGHVNIRGYGTDRSQKSLRFAYRTVPADGGPPVVLPRQHPLNEILKKVLRWFGARYELREPRCELNHLSWPDSDDDETNAARASQEDPEFAKRRKEMLEIMAECSSSPPTPPPSPATRAARRAAKAARKAELEQKLADAKAAAANLHGHAPMINLLRDALENMEWPNADAYYAASGARTGAPSSPQAAPGAAEQVGEEVAPPAQGDDSAVATGSKRGCEVLGDTSGNASKRQRT